eukprot:g6232.t2
MSTAAVGSTSRRAPTSLRELLERVPQVLDGQAPGALQLESCASTDAMETMARAEARLLKSADTFFEPLFRVSVLDNLGRKEDPFAEPGDEDFPDQAPVEELRAERRRVDAIADRAISEQPPLKASAERVQQQAARLQERMEKLALEAEAASSGRGGGAGLLDTVYAGEGAESAAEKARESDRKDDEALKRGAELLAQAEARRASLLKEVVARRAGLARQQREVDALEKEEAMALAMTVAGPAGSPSGAGRRVEASRETENLAGVTGMSDTQLERCVREEEALVKRNGDIRGWYEATVANVELLGGVRVSHRLLFGTAGGGGVEGMELMVDLGPGQIMEVTVSAVDGGLTSVQLCHAQSNAAGAGVSEADLEELRRTADALPAPQNLRMLVREALGRARCAAVMEEHVRLMRKRYVTAYTALPREFTVTLNAGLVAGFRLHVDYPKVAGGAELVSLVGVGGWNAEETEQIRRRVNGMALPTLGEAVDALEAAAEAFETVQQ